MASGSKPRGVNPRAARGKRTGKAKLSGGDRPKGDLIVIANAEAKVRSNRNGAPTAAGADMGQLTALFDPANVNLIPLFGRPEDRLQREAPPLATMAAVHDTRAPDLSLFYRVDAPHEQLADLAESLRRNDSFEAAYIKPFTERPQFNTQAPAMGDPPPATPDFTKCQGYLNPAPEGVDARYAWNFDGGNGAGVGIIDIEGAWRFSHEVLSQLGGVAGGIQLTDLNWRNHGTAVLGVMGGAGKGFGVTGICHGATIRSISHGGPQQTTATAIRLAADLLSPGDIILLEAHRPGPQSPTPFMSNPLQQGYIAIEWWPDDYAAIVYAVRKGIIVVGAAGNGAVSLDAPIYDQHPNAAGSFGPFPMWWENPFRRVNLDSGAILVGAGAPLPETGPPLPEVSGRIALVWRSRISDSPSTPRAGATAWSRPGTAISRGRSSSKIFGIPAISMVPPAPLRSSSAPWRVYRGRSRRPVDRCSHRWLPATFSARQARCKLSRLDRKPPNESAIART